MFIVVACLGMVLYSNLGHAKAEEAEFIQACVPYAAGSGAQRSRAQIAACLGWKTQVAPSFCPGYYQPLPLNPLADSSAIELKADQISFYTAGQSTLRGHVQLKQTQRMVTAQTAKVYRDASTHHINRIELDTNVHLMEPGRLIIADHASLNPQDKSGHMDQVVYRFDTTRSSAILPAWGTAEWIKRFANENYQLHKVTYTTCSPADSAWQIQAQDIQLDHAHQTGVARNAVLRLGKLPILYTPYLSFPTSSARKSGFLMPLAGYTNVSGFDVALPYYLNLAPNYDATIVPHYYSLRGWMMGGTTRFLTEHSSGIMGGSILPHDTALQSFITQNETQYPRIQGTSNDRWSVMVRENTQFLPNLNLNIDFQQVSDDYYLQDFNTNLAMSSENQLLRRGSLVYTTDHWLFGGMLQSYQTLHPINQSEVANIYDRLPQLLAEGEYHDLPGHADLNVLGQYDYFRWTGLDRSIPQGSRYHANPILSFPHIAPWGYVTPTMELVENNYGLFYNTDIYGLGLSQSEAFNRLIPRFYVDTGLNFERMTKLFSNSMRQTLEPRLFYLLVPYQNQSQFPAFDSAYMIFNTDQLFRTNRFSGFDRISDANQLAYALTSRWLSPHSGREKASVTVGQLRYFSERKVQLCYRQDGQCTDSPQFLGYTSLTNMWSPIATKAHYNLNAAWSTSADFVWDLHTNSTNNANLNLHYQPSPERILGLGYNYLASGNVIVAPQGYLITDSFKQIQSSAMNAALNQITASYAWPFTDHWSSLGVYSYNISKQYDMLSFFGVQYDSCCWAARLIGGRTFKSLGVDSLTPEYNNNIYFQILLKGLGSVATSNPGTTIQSYLPGYPNLFR